MGGQSKPSKKAEGVSNTASDYAKQYNADYTAANAGLTTANQGLQSVADTASNQYKTFDTNAYGKSMTTAQSALNAYNARRGGANSAKAALLGSLNNETNLANATAAGYGIQSNLGNLATISGSAASKGYADQAEISAGAEGKATENAITGYGVTKETE